MPRNLLVADDSLTIRKVIGMIFSTEDFQVHTVDNGVDAIHKARELRPDIVLADVMMPGKSGYEVCEALKSDPATQGIPVVLLAGTFEAFDENRARAARADDHVTKPFESQVLLDKVKALVGTSSAAPAPRVAAPTPVPQVLPVPGAAPGVPRPSRPGIPAVPGVPSPRPGGVPPTRPGGIPVAQPMPGPRPGMPPPGVPVPVGGRPMPGIPPGMPRPAAPGMPPPGMHGARPMPGMPGAPMAPGMRPGGPPPPAGLRPIGPHGLTPGAPTPAGGYPRAHGPGVPLPPGARPLPGVPLGPGVPRSVAPPRPPPPEPSVVVEDQMPAPSGAEEISVDVGVPAARVQPADGGEAVLREALSRASREVVEKIAWEVVPQLAETIIREELERLIKDREGKS